LAQSQERQAGRWNLALGRGTCGAGAGHGDRGKINSILRLEGITDYITITIDDTVVCERGQFKI
jgi:hypothetical protein